LECVVAFAARNLSVLAYANGFTLWHYKAGVEDNTIVGNPGFFACADDMLSAGDIIMVSATEGARLLCLVPDRGGVRATQLS
jgi:outer membrane protein assembly factor BamB